MSPAPGRRLLGAATMLMVAGCGGGGPTISLADLGLASAVASRPLATADVATTPDGGFYRNPNALAVTLLTRHDPEPIMKRLDGAAASWQALRALGPFTIVALRLRNDGKVGSEPELDDLQMASDFAPPGTATGPLRHFYHPTFPLAALSDVALTANCGVHLDPAQGATVLLVYPPLREAPELLWGRYQGFALPLRWGGGIAPFAGALHLGVCTPPRPP